MARAVARLVVDRAGAEAWLSERDDIVVEVREGPAPDLDAGGTQTASFSGTTGPVIGYRREVVVEPLHDDRFQVTSEASFGIAIPYFGRLFVPVVVRALRRTPTQGGRQPWWAPPDRLDARAASVLGVLAAASLVAGYLGTLLTQTITYAVDDFGITDDRAQGAALATVRIGIALALILVAVADHKGRRIVLLVAATGGVLFAATGALAPSLPWLTASQTASRAFSTALALLIAIVAAEEMPRGSRAYAVSVLGMSAALGAGQCVLFLPLADIGEGGWRILYLLPLLALPLVRGIARRLPESRRFGAPHNDVGLAGHGGRLALLAASALLLSLFTAPASQFQNEFLRDERGFSAAGITVFTILTNTPGGIGIVIGGRLADVKGRRLVGAVGLIGGVGATVLMYLSGGAGIYVWSVIGAVVGAATVPALGVYGPELFPTSLRGKANGVIGVCGVIGASVGLLMAGMLSDRFGGLGPALAVLAVGPLILVALVLIAYPETAHRELEDINPEDDLPVTPSLPLA
ncbi:MAG: MFS transporter [Acidimicrobiales bacterium]